MSEWNRDQWELICKRQLNGRLDGGDTAANEGTFIFCSILLNNGLASFQYAKCIFDKLEYAPGCWRRHPDTTKWYAQPGMDRWSRDQSIPILCAMSLTDTDRARAFYENHRSRLFLMMPNNGYKNGVYESAPGNTKKKLFGDPTLFEYYSILIRSCRFEHKYWMLPFLDLELLFGSLFRRLFSKDRDVRNHILSLVLSNIIYPTWASKLAARVMDKKKLIDDITYWFRDRSEGEPPMHELLVPVVEKYLLKEPNA